MSDNCILKLSVETEDEKYLAVVIPQLQFNSFLWFVCAISLLARNFLLWNLMILQVFVLEGTYWSFSKPQKNS